MNIRYLGTSSTFATKRSLSIVGAALLSLTETGLQPSKETGPHFGDEPNEEIFIVIGVLGVDGMP